MLERMMRRMTLPFALILMMGMCGVSLAADGDQPAPGPGPGGPPPGLVGAIMRRVMDPNGPMGMMGQNALSETMRIVAELNLTPDFTLTVEQKQKIQAIRDEFKKQQQKWQQDHAAEIKDIQKQMADAQENGGGPEDMQKIAQASRKLQESAPKGDEFVKQIKAVLTTDQLDQVEAKQDELAKQREKMMKERFGPGGGPGGGPGEPKDRP